MGDRVLTDDQFLYRELVGTELSVTALPTRQCQVYRPDHKMGKVVHVRVTDTVGEVIAGLRPDDDPHPFICTIRGTDSPLVLEERFVSLVPRGTPVQIQKLQLQCTIKYGSREHIECLPDEARFHELRLLAIPNCLRVYEWRPRFPESEDDGEFHQRVTVEELQDRAETTNH
jgi:hypothetical protein